MLSSNAKKNTESDKIDKDITQILDAIKLHLDVADLKSRVLKCASQLKIKQWKDSYGFDLLHHCIIENNIIAFMFLNSQGYFKSPYEPSTWPYLHLVSIFGYKSFISSIIQDVKYQNNKVQLDWTTFDAAIKPKVSHINESMLKDLDKTRSFTPIDIAGIFGHIRCVSLLLDFWQVQNERNSRRKSTTSTSPIYLSLACRVNSPDALRLLLTEYSDKKEAIECALRMMTPECVDVVLRDRGDFDCHQSFHGMNLYHVLFSYNSCLTLGQYEKMGEMSSVLLRHGQDVNACRPSRTYPLYSLLSHVPALTSFEKSEPYLMATLLLLLKAGADPNVDEILIEEHVRDQEETTAFGRRPYSSAVNCILSTLPLLKVSSESDPADDYAYKCIELLLRHGADLSYMGKFDQQPSDYLDTLDNYDCYNFGSSLHLLASNRVESPLNYPILRLILHYGIVADARGSWHLPLLKFKIKYAVNIIPFAAWLQDSVSSDSGHQKEFSDMDLKCMFYIMKFMSLGSLKLAYKEFKDTFESIDKTETRSVLVCKQEHFSKIVEEYERVTQQPWQLQRYCAHIIWQACRHHMGNVFDLPIPGGLRNVIMKYH